MNFPKKILISLFLMVFVFSMVGCGGEVAENGDVILATTTSTRDSGLLDVLIPEFEEEYGYNLKMIAVGTGQALEMGKKGEADVLLVHAPASEQELVDEGIGINYRLVMHNDFILVGPENDPAGIQGTETAVEALTKIAENDSIFVSRGDDSGTHKKELAFWQEAEIDPNGLENYLETGQGMGHTLVVASEKQAYTLTDRATYLAQKENLDLTLMVEGDKDLLNIYHVMQVNPEKFSEVNGPGGEAFVEFMVSSETQAIIKDFGKDEYGEPLFFPDAGKEAEFNN